MLVSMMRLRSRCVTTMSPAENSPFHWRSVSVGKPQPMRSSDVLIVAAPGRAHVRIRQVDISVAASDRVTSLVAQRTLARRTQEYRRATRQTELNGLVPQVNTNACVRR